MPLTPDAIVIRFTGDSGDGVQLVGEQLTITAALAGRDVRTLPDFPAEIRAPLGTVAGVSGFQLAMADHVLFTAGEALDVLVALNPAALKQALPYLSHGGLLILNDDSMSAKDWEKAGCTPELLTEVAEFYHILRIPLIKNTVAALSGLALTQPQAKKAKNFYVLGVVMWLFDLPLDHTLAFIEKKFQRAPLVLDGNKRALMAGYNYALTLELSRRPYQQGQLQRPAGDYRQITGVEAVALAIATLATGTKTPFLVAGYPITPASSILHECVKLADFGVKLFQAEDEIAAICACIGAAFGGSLALTCTSGPGLDLKSESLGLAVITELPLVVIDVQRAGASTGMPTKTGQSDLHQALYGRHGEAPLPVLAARSPADCFNTLLEAFRIAVKFMTPVIVLMDAYVANAAEPWLIPNPDTLCLPEIKTHRFTKPFAREEWLGRSWNPPGVEAGIHQLGGLEKYGEDGRISYDAANHQQMVALRAEKIANVAQDYPSLTLEGHADARVVLVGWGSTYGSLLAAVKRCADDGLPVALLHLRHLNPLPRDLGEQLRRFEQVLVAELNAGQLVQLLRADYLVDAVPLNQCTGQPFSTDWLVKAITQQVQRV
jgi:2-oxoglutarate ferredoxin oxidoreductase subunit alpha